MITIPAGKNGSFLISYETVYCSEVFDNFEPRGDVSFEALLKVNSFSTNNKAVTLSSQTQPYYNLRQAQDPPLKIRFDTYNPDGDSLRFKLVSVTGGQGDHGTFNVSYENGFSPQSPFPSSIPIYINPRTGTITGKPDSIGNYLAKIQVEEYRFVSGIWMLVDYSEREVPIIINNRNFNPTRNSWSLQLDSSMSNSGNPVLSCGDSTIRLKAPVAVNEMSLSPDGSEFSLIGSHGNYPIKGAKLEFGNEILLTLADTVAISDTLQLSLRRGRDTNVLYSVCNQKVIRDTFTLYTQCQQSGVGLSESGSETLEVYPNPVTHKLQVKQKGSPQTIQLLNAQGQVVWQIKTDQAKTQLSTQHLARGLYWVAVGHQRRRVLVR